LDDDVKVEDVAKRMQVVIEDLKSKGSLVSPFDMIVHSTGGLVARQWLTTFYPTGAACPLKRLLMLAPANFGSKLAAMGQSMLGRLIKGWKNWFHTGREMLRALELASPFQWELAQRDLFVPEGQAAAPSPYGANGVWPFVIIGTHPYNELLRQIVNESGADGTVRVPAANLNVYGITIDFSANEENPTKTPWQLRHGDWQFPFAVLPDRNHGTIITPEDNGSIGSTSAAQARLGELILEALACDSSAKYVDMATNTWPQISEATAALAGDAAVRDGIFPEEQPNPEYFNQYLQVIARVLDDHGAEVGDYFLEFFAPDVRSDDDVVYFHSKVLEDVHPDQDCPANRCLFIDRTDLVTNYYPLIPPNRTKQVAMSISANPPGDNVSFFSQGKFGAAGHLIVHRADPTAAEPRWLHRNCTHFVKIIIPRNPVDGVYKLTKSFN
jgi:hypothetical protein